MELNREKVRGGWYRIDDKELWGTGRRGVRGTELGCRFSLHGAWMGRNEKSQTGLSKFEGAMKTRCQSMNNHTRTIFVLSCVHNLALCMRLWVCVFGEGEMGWGIEEWWGEWEREKMCVCFFSIGMLQRTLFVYARLLCIQPIMTCRYQRSLVFT